MSAEQTSGGGGLKGRVTADRATPAGERERWGATWYESPYLDGRQRPYVYEQSDHGRTMRWRMDSMPQAKAVAAALNALEAKHV